MKFLSLLLFFRLGFGDRPDTFFNQNAGAVVHSETPEARTGRDLEAGPLAGHAAHGAAAGVHAGFGQQFARTGRQGYAAAAPGLGFAQGTGQLELNSVECKQSEEEVCATISETVCESTPDESCFSVTEMQCSPKNEEVCSTTVSVSVQQQCVSVAEASCTTDIERQCINVNEMQCSTASEQQCITDFWPSFAAAEWFSVSAHSRTALEHLDCARRQTDTDYLDYCPSPAANTSRPTLLSQR